ncbi:MAG: hypothetical protein ACI8QC_000948 [Planctomycetota bacterium]|jgi:hypothetical protein
MSKRTQAILLGVLLWGGLAAGIALRIQRAYAERPETRQVSARLKDFALGQTRRIQLDLPNPDAAYGDPIFAQLASGEWIQAGYLSDVLNGEFSSKAQAIWYTHEFAPKDCAFIYHRNRGTIADVVATLLPPDKRARIAEHFRTASIEHGRSIQAALAPVVERSLRESVPVIEAALMASLAKHSSQAEALGERYEEIFLRQRLVPLVRSEVLPTVQLHTEPVARMIGLELWQRASVWRFGWRALYDSTPLPDRDLLAKEFDRYLQEEVVPVVESHTDDLAEVTQLVVRDVLQNPRLRAELRQMAGEAAADPKLQALLKTVMTEALLKNEALREVWISNWQAQEAQRALNMAGARLDPVIREIGDELFGTKATGIHPDFARVLRNQVLGKDRRWIVAVPGGAPGNDPQQEPVRASSASEHAVYPLVVMATPEAPTPEAPTAEAQ